MEKKIIVCFDREPLRSLNRLWQTLQYNLRIVLSLPIRSATDRLSPPKTLKHAQSGFGQAKNLRGNWGDWVFLGLLVWENGERGTKKPDFTLSTYNNTVIE